MNLLKSTNALAYNRDAMEIDKKEYKELLLWLWGMVERARTELIASQVAVMFMKAAGDGHTFDQFLEGKLVSILRHAYSQIIRK